MQLHILLITSHPIVNHAHVQFKITKNSPSIWVHIFSTVPVFSKKKKTKKNPTQNKLGLFTVFSIRSLCPSPLGEDHNCEAGANS